MVVPLPALVSLLTLACSGTSRASEIGESQPTSTLDGALLDPGLTADTDLVLFPRAARPQPRPEVIVATRVAAPPTVVSATLLDIGKLREAVPALVRADVIQTRAGPRPDAWPDRLLAWELEIPLFNLKGRAWLRQRAGGAELALVEGAFAPGVIRVQVAASPDGRGTTLTCALRVEVRTTNFIFRKVARHDPWAETAMTAATSWVIARSLALRAEAPDGQPPARPKGSIQPPPAASLDAALLAAPSLAAARARGVLGAVRRGAGGRLVWAAVAPSVAGDLPALASRLATPETWSAFPGWKKVARRPSARQPAEDARATPRTIARGVSVGPASQGPTTLIDVEDDVSLVDLDATWSVDLRPPGRAMVIEGATRGAVLAWHALPVRESPGQALAILAMHPRLDAAGFVERRLIAAEPLLEHGLALALAYVDAAAVAERLSVPTPAPVSPARGVDAH